jgi:hypothetical protein
MKLKNCFSFLVILIGITSLFFTTIDCSVPQPTPRQPLRTQEELVRIFRSEPREIMTQKKREHEALIKHLQEEAALTATEHQMDIDEVKTARGTLEAAISKFSKESTELLTIAEQSLTNFQNNFELFINTVASNIEELTGFLNALQNTTEPEKQLLIKRINFAKTLQSKLMNEMKTLSTTPMGELSAHMHAFTEKQKGLTTLLEELTKLLKPQTRK